MSDLERGERKPPSLPPKPIRGDDEPQRATTPEPGPQRPSIPPKPDRFRVAPEATPNANQKIAAPRPLTDYNVKHVVKLQALVRRHLCIVKWRTYVKMIGKRTNVAKEILSTEKQYVQNLRNLVAGFLQPLRENAKSTTPLLTEDNLKSMFSDIEVILGYHTLLEKELEKRISAWSQSVKLGDIFLKIASFLKTYNQYIQHYKKANLLLADLNKNPEFAAMMEKLRFSPTCGGKGIKDFLIMPVQRIPRYSMLLQDMVKNTWPHHADYEPLSAALKAILVLASYVEEQQGENANVNKVLEVQNMLLGKVIEGTKLVQPSRRYVRECPATKHERDGKQFPVHLFLFNDILIWAKPKKNDTHEVIKLDSLITLIVKDAEMGLLDATTHARAMGIVTPQGASTVILASPDEKKQWQVDLRKFIKESNDKYNAVKKSAGGDAGATDDMMDILNYQKVTPAAVHGTKKEEGSAIAREVNAFSDKIKSGFTSVLSRASGGSRREEDGEERQRSNSVNRAPASSPRQGRHGSMINVAKPEPVTPVRSPRAATLTSSNSSGSINTPPKLSASARSMSLLTPKSGSDLPSPTTPKRNGSTDVAAVPSTPSAPLAATAPATPAATPALLPTPSPAPANPPAPESPKNATRAEASPRHQRKEKKEKKEKTKRGTLDTPDASPRKERVPRPSKSRDASDRPAGYSTLRVEKTASPVPPELAPQASPTAASLALDANTQAKLTRLKDENEEAARRLKKMQEKFGAVEQK